MKKLAKISLPLLGFFILSIFIWMRFIRVRLPREIPFDISYFSFSIYLFLCILYLFIIIYTLYCIIRYKFTQFTYKINWDFKTGAFFEKIEHFLDYIEFKFNRFFSILFYPLTQTIHYIYLPVIKLDTMIKNHPIIYPYYKQFILKIIKLFPLPDLFGGENEKVFTKRYFYIYFFLFFFIRIIFISVFIIDIFYFQYLFYIYKIIPLAIFLILAKYLFYSLKTFKESQIEFLAYACCAVESDEWVKLTGGYSGDIARELNIMPNCLKPRYFIELQVEYLIDWCLTYKFHAGTTYQFREDCKRNYNQTYKQSWDNLQLIINEEIIPIAYIVTHLTVIKRDSQLLRTIKLIIYSLYFVCFSYLLVINLFAKFCIIFVIL